MKSVITGGAGFIGSNLAAHLLKAGEQVVILDSFARPGAKINSAWLETLDGDLNVIHGDVRDARAMREAVRNADAVYHLAAQVAVTTSVADPRSDFEINALGTFNLLEAVRAECPNAFVLYSSTNKVYGGLEDVGVRLQDGRYALASLPEGIPETQPLDFHSPYGCSKGAGDQYVRDYARIYELRTVVFRQGCIYGPRQFGTEDQGWVAHFMIQALKGAGITIYGDGRQVRDILHVDDLIAWFDAARQRADDLRGEVFNIGGGPGNTLSLLELLDYLKASLGHPIAHDFSEWRPGDQRIYVSNIGKVTQRLGRSPAISVREGLNSLLDWLRDHAGAAGLPKTAQVLEA